jgi:hypothetical protein
MTAYMTIRELKEIEAHAGRAIKLIKDFEFIARQRWHPKFNELNLLFKLANKNRAIKSCQMAKNCIEIYKYHRVGRLSRANHRILS